MFKDLINDPGLAIQYGIEQREFLVACAELEKKFQFNIDYHLFNICLGSRSAKYNIPHHYISFVYYCLVLDKDNIDITYLIQQFREAQKQGSAENIIHTASLAVLAYIYHRNNNVIEFLSVKPVKNGGNTRISGDIRIDGITAELKTLQNTIVKNCANNNIVIKDNQVDIGNTIIAGLAKIFRDKVRNAAAQAEMVFIDCTNLPFFDTLSLSMEKIERLVEPKKSRVVFYTTKHYPPNVNLSFHDSNGYSKSFGKILAPDLDKMFSIYIDFDHDFYQYLSLSKDPF